MKSIYLFLVLCTPLVIFAQKIKEKKYDRFDSAQQISTATEAMAGKMMTPHYLVSYCSWIKVMTAASSKDDPRFFVTFMFKTTSVTSLDDKCEMKIEFIDNTISTYKYFGEYKILTSNDYASFSAEALDNSPLFSKDIKTVRIRTSDQIYEYEIKEKVAGKVKGSLSLISDEIKKGF